MIIIPALGRTRSSLVAGIFYASGAWVGDTTVSKVRQYDAFENWDVIMYLQKNFALRDPMTMEQAQAAAPAFRNFVNDLVPEGRLPCFKFVWYYDLLFRYAFPDAHYYFVSRDFMERALSEGKPVAWWSERITMFSDYQNNMLDGVWIDGEKLRVRDFSEIRPLIDQHSALQWNRQAVNAVYASNGASKFEYMQRMRR